MAILSTAHRLLAGLQLLSLGVASVAAVAVTPRSIATDLQGLVRTSAVGVTLRERWNEFEAPLPVVVVNATCESDIQAVVRYCSKNNVPLLPQNGGNGWAFFDKSKSGTPSGVVLNLAGLNQVKVSADKQTAIVGGGAIISDVVAAADAAGVLVQTGNCNCVGALGAGLGGGYGNLIGELGMAVDNMISLRVITADGKAVTVSPTSNPDLWWAMRGAGPNFGIVTYATYKAVPTADRNAWLMSLTFDGSRVAEVAQAVQDLPLLPNQVVFFILSNQAVVVTGFLRGGDEEAGRKAFKPLFDLGPSTNSSSVNPYPKWNVPNDFFCARGDRKPAFTTTLSDMKAASWPAVFDLYNEFQKLPTAENSAILVERYNLTKAQSVGRGATAVHDELRFDSFAQAVVIPWYKDLALDTQALDFASKVRDIWAGPAGGKKNSAYINFAHGDEDLIAVYGSSLPRLQQLKKKYDPKNVFGQWFSLQ
ncbi:FAD binding domain-containing protein [Microdochium trichocladiopsis]|uniref:FAD binding domain-containing protein n=1 Tax=Microdochium trichocladiopsis TaxID=1682393 RepID=A0A9P8XRL5_9PEZI|nr:FAD binding domain-containing protein [Microdochium trichocladiopsis]KAH7014139.1 FAD binding domain-containing protein [Microdochium trichocladiopsis]